MLSSFKVFRAQGYLFAHALEQGGVGVGVGLDRVAPGLAVLHALDGGQGAPPLLCVAHGCDEGRVGPHVGLHPCTAQEGLELKVQGSAVLHVSHGRDEGRIDLNIRLHPAQPRGFLLPQS